MVTTTEQTLLVKFKPLLNRHSVNALDVNSECTGLVTSVLTTNDIIQPFRFQAVKRFMKLECKCHGVSGSCALRTCWLAMSDFRRTGDYLRKKYNTAIEVTMNQDGTGFMVADKDFKGTTKNELVYVEKSPDYCLMDRAAGGSTQPVQGVR